MSSRRAKTVRAKNRLDPAPATVPAARRPFDWRTATELVVDVLRLAVPYVESLENPSVPSTERAKRLESKAIVVLRAVDRALRPLRRMYRFEYERREVALQLEYLRDIYSARLGEFEKEGQRKLSDRAYHREIRLWCEEYKFPFGESFEVLELSDGEIRYGDKDSQRRVNRGLEVLRGAKSRGTSRAAAYAYRELHRALGIKCNGVRTLGGIMGDYSMDRLHGTPFGIEGRKGAEIAVEYLLRAFGVDDEKLIGIVTDAVIAAQSPEHDDTE